MVISEALGLDAPYPYIRIPKLLLKDPGYAMVSPEAKLMYGLMMDRTSLSNRNRHKFTNEKGEVYIYFSQQEIMQILACGHDKAGRVFKELIDAGLIKARRRGIGKPYEIILLPKVWSAQQKEQISVNPPQVCENPDYSLFGIIDGNNTDLINPDSNNPEDYLRRYLKSAVGYDSLITSYAPTLVNRILDVVVNTIAQETEEFLIGNEPVSAEIVKESLRNLRKENVIYAVKKIKNASYTTDHSDAFVLNALCEAIKNQET